MPSHGLNDPAYDSYLRLAGAFKSGSLRLVHHLLLCCSFFYVVLGGVSLVIALTSLVSAPKYVMPSHGLNDPAYDSYLRLAGAFKRARFAWFITYFSAVASFTLFFQAFR